MKQCPQCRRSYDDSQSFCLMDGTPLINESEEETVVRKSPAPKKRSWLLWLGLAGLLIGSGIVLAGGLLIYNYAGRNDNTQVKNNGNVSKTPTRTATSTPKATPTPTAANTNANTESSPETKESPADSNSPDEEVTPIDWSTSAVGFKNDVGMTYKFQCPPEGKESAIWGSDIYTADSSICTAAVHAGLITLAEGGIVTIEYRPGRLTYGSTTRNGIKSNTFGEYSRSFVVR
jgi:cytoskeletal protein RodZ